ncbi:hypothetical protein JCM10212_003853 [Sporobolomyces blumeae]
MSVLDIDSEADIVTLLQGAALLIPRTTNPFTVFRQQLETASTGHAPSSLGPWLIGASVLLSTSSLLYIAGLVVRWRRGTLWFFRTVTVDRETFVLPHYIVSYVTMITFFCLCIQGFLWELYVKAEEQRFSKDYFLASSLPWIPGVTAVCIGAWSLTTTCKSRVLHLRTYGQDKVPWYTSARFVNTLGISLPILALCTLLPLGVVASERLKSSLVALSRADSVLLELASTWSPGTQVDPAQFELYANPLWSFVQGWTRFQSRAATFFAVLAAWCAALGTGFVAVGIAYLSALRRSIRHMTGRTKTGVETFERTFKWLTIITVTFGTTMIALAANVAWIAAMVKQIMQGSFVGELASLLPLYTVAVLAVPASTLLLYHAVSIPTTSSRVSQLDDARPTTTTAVGPSSLRSKLAFNRAETHEIETTLDPRYPSLTTQYYLATGLALNHLFPFGSASTSSAMSPPLELDERDPRHPRRSTLPFDSLALDMPPLDDDDDQAVRGGEKRGRTLSRQKRGHCCTTRTRGIAIERMQETVTVVALPKDGIDREPTGPGAGPRGDASFEDDRDDDDRKW